jgi:hypothetical protein
MNHSSHVESPSMFPLAPAVKLVDVAATTKPPLLGATETLHGAVAVELPVNGATVVLFPIALTPAAYQNEYRVPPTGSQRISLMVRGA